MSQCVALIHNSPVIIDVVRNVFKNVYPEAKLYNIMDESLLRDIKERGGIDYLGIRRVYRYALCAEDLGADAVLMTCSSLCEAVFAARPMLKIPAFAINEPMAEEAVEKGTRIVVMGTLRSVLAPTTRLVQSKAVNAGKRIEVEEVLCAAAFDALMAGQPQRHDELLMDEVDRAAGKGDVILFGQGSMSRLVTEARNRVRVPVLESLESGVKQVRDHFATRRPAAGGGA
jgi:Asp/Glu/hydantoin racemase